MTKIFNVQLIARGKYEAEQVDVRRAIVPSRADDILLGGSTYFTVAGNLHHIDAVYEKYPVVVQSLRDDYTLFNNFHIFTLAYR